METNNNEDREMKMPSSNITESHHSHIAPILGVLIIMLVLILVGLYLWGGMLSKEQSVIEDTPIVNNEPETPRAEADVQIYETLSPSDELEAIEADLDGTNLDTLDADLNAIDAELDEALGQ